MQPSENPLHGASKGTSLQHAGDPRCGEIQWKLLENFFKMIFFFGISHEKSIKKPEKCSYMPKNTSLHVFHVFLHSESH